jgi:hypothetical protein
MRVRNDPVCARRVGKPGEVRQWISGLEPVGAKDLWAYGRQRTGARQRCTARHAE